MSGRKAAKNSGKRNGSSCSGVGFLIPSPPEENSVHVSPVTFLFRNNFCRICDGRLRFRFARKLRGNGDAVADRQRPSSARLRADRAEEKIDHEENDEGKEGTKAGRRTKRDSQAGRRKHAAAGPVPIGLQFRDRRRGEGGIRTLGTLLGYGALAKRCFRPLSHLTNRLREYGVGGYSST